MKAADLDRYGCTLNGRRITYGSLRNYVCNECGGAAGHRFVPTESGKTVDKVACARCGCEDIISERLYLEQISDGWEVELGLPDNLRELVRQQRGQTDRCQSAIEAIDDLFG